MKLRNKTEVFEYLAEQYAEYVERPVASGGGSAQCPDYFPFLCLMLRRLVIAGQVSRALMEDCAYDLNQFRTSRSGVGGGFWDVDDHKGRLLALAFLITQPEDMT